MQSFYLSQPQWPTADQKITLGIEGGSPLVWTMLSPTLATAQLQTYAWDGYLANLMPWTSSPTDCVKVRPPLLSHARWNIRHDSDSTKPLPGADSSINSALNHPAALENPTLLVTNNSQQQGWPKVLAPATDGPSTYAQSQLQTNPNLEPTTYSTLVAMLFPHTAHPICGPSLNTTNKTWQTPSTDLYYVPPTAHMLEKFCITNLWWTIALLHLHWNTAWDLTTHWNVETLYAWVGPAQAIGI